jgi:hypothetical protein
VQKQVLTAGLVLVLGAVALQSCDDINTVTRPAQPLVMTGSQLPTLVGAAPGAVVAFSKQPVGDSIDWVQVPVQIDQRKVVPFGAQPASNGTAGVTGTVYGSGTGGPTALQYADPNTFVGADPDPTFDADDELVFMVSDAGGKARDDGLAEPTGVVAGSGVQVQVDDPRGEDQSAWVYLFRSDGTLDPAAGRDYVDYRFTLTSGDYRTTYRRATGPNPETSKVSTRAYESDLTDRWKEVGWRIKVLNSTGVDILDGHKNQFATGNCGRSNQTFADGEGAFVANIDGPVRAIRSYVGANSGPLTQRTHFFYLDMEETVTNLRVHPIPSVMDFLDYSAAAQGMTYRSSTVPDGVTIDGVPDSVPSAVPQWEAVDGPQGRVETRSWSTGDVAGVDAGTTQFYRDQSDPTDAQCWGDGSYFGASGSFVQAAIPNTDPRTTPFATLTSHRATRFGAPARDGDAVRASAADWAGDLTTPLTVTVSALAP